MVAMFESLLHVMVMVMVGWWDSVLMSAVFLVLRDRPFGLAG
jgi:hypothetical protein